MKTRRHCFMEVFIKSETHEDTFVPTIGSERIFLKAILWHNTTLMCIRYSIIFVVYCIVIVL